MKALRTAFIKDSCTVRTAHICYQRVATKEFNPL